MEYLICYTWETWIFLALAIRNVVTLSTFAFIYHTMVLNLVYAPRAESKQLQT